MNIGDIRPGQLLSGIIQGEVVTVKSVTPLGDEMIDIIYRRSDGSVGQQMLMPMNMSGIREVKDSKYTFGCDASTFQIVSEANRIRMAYLFDPYIAVHTSSIEPLPHQITAVYETMLQKHPLRYVLADDPGAGKTIMAGLLIKELIMRGDVKRCLVVAPGNIVEQWQDELYQKFNIRFEILTNDMIESAASGNAFEEHDLLIARLDKLSRNDDVQNKIRAAAEWDLVIIDEAHKMSASVMGNKISYTKRYKLGQLLSKMTRHYLLMTATPHNGKDEDFQQFMSLIDADRFQAHSKGTKTTSTYDDVMRRLVKEELLKFDGTHLFPERFADTITYELSGPEMSLYNDVTNYVRNQFNRAERLNEQKKTAVGFALTVLQRRLASSPEAIYQSLKRRRERLQSRMEDIKALKNVDNPGMDDDFDEDDYSDEEMEQMEDNLLDEATAAQTIEELKAEITTLVDLECKANVIRHSNRDKKWEQLSNLLQSPELHQSSGAMEKIIIFTEHRDTLKYLKDKVVNLLGSKDAVMTICGGMSRDDRKNAQNKFRQDKNVSVLIATDAAGEGINLQRAHYLVNYDLPWNPNRIEQRFGRIHRIGQKDICRMWNMVAKGTREGDVFQSLFAKLEEERKSLGGKVYDVLGKLTFDNKPLREILIDAIRTDNEPEHREYLSRVVNNALDTGHLVNLLNDYALSKEVMDIGAVIKVREQMERMEARRLQPYYVQDFFARAFTEAGGSFYKREPNRFEVTHVPHELREILGSTQWGTKVLRRYERITFVREGVNCDGKPTADLISPGHPLLDALIEWVNRKYGEEYRKGGILIDSSNKSASPRLMCCLDTSIRDAVMEDGENRIIARRMSFVELDSAGHASNGGFAPYLDYDPVPTGKITKMRQIVNSAEWMGSDVEKLAVSYAAKAIIPEMFTETRDSRLATIQKIKHEVESRLQAEVNYWDRKAAEYKDKLKKDGDNNIVRSNMEKAEGKANELDARKKARLAELNREEQIAPMTPVLTSVAIVIPASMLEDTPSQQLYGRDRKAVEDAAMKAVMEIERRMGFEPRDVSMDNCGYDIESVIPIDKRPQYSGNAIRCIEVKGRALEHAGSVTVSRNEMNTAMNIPERFILALVTVDKDKTETTYCMDCFSMRPPTASSSVNFDTNRLIDGSRVIYDERSNR